MNCPQCKQHELTELMQNEHGNVAYDCPLCGVVHKSDFPRYDDGDDGLRLCHICRDRYATQGRDVCHACREQQMIDDAVPDGPIVWYDEDEDEGDDDV